MRLLSPCLGFSLVLVFVLQIDTGSSEPVSIPPDVLDSHRSYSYSVLRDKYARKSEENVGAAGYSTFGLGLMLAVLNEKFFPMDVYGFDNALKLPRSKIFSSYQQILKSLTNDEKIQIFNDIYSSVNYTLPENLKALDTQFSFIDYNTTISNVNSAVAEINARIAVQTAGKIYGTLIPQGSWWGNPFFNYTTGILVNTFHYSSVLANKRTKTSVEKFSDGENVSFFETTGLPLSSPRDKYVAVRIPFKNSAKSLVLVLPNNLTTFIKDDLEQHLRKVYTDTRVEKTVPVKIPALNFSIPTSYFRQLKKLGITESMCRYDQMKKNVFESAAQNVHVSLTEDFTFQVAAATGTHVNHVETFLAIHNSDSEPQVEEDEISQDDHEEDREQMAKLKSDLFFDDQVQYRGLTSKSKSKYKTQVKYDETVRRQSAEVKSQETGTGQSAEEGENPDSDAPLTGPVVFNKPFFYYLDDEVLGPIFYGSVSSFKQYRLHVADVPPAGHEWQSEAMRYLYWACP